VNSINQHTRPHGRHAGALLAVVLAGSLVTGCTSQDGPTPSPSTQRPSLAACRAYGLPTAPVTLKLPGLRLREARPLPARTGEGPRLALMADDEEGANQQATVSASLFDGPALVSAEGLRSGIWVGNYVDTRYWALIPPDESAITLTKVADTAQATDISHSTFIVGSAPRPVTFDYWAFTASGHRYMLSYARTSKAKTPDAATFFATTISCPKSVT
jgi:hypothetical protein